MLFRDTLVWITLISQFLLELSNVFEAKSWASILEVSSAEFVLFALSSGGGAPTSVLLLMIPMPLFPVVGSMVLLNYCCEFVLEFILICELFNSFVNYYCCSELILFICFCPSSWLLLFNSIAASPSLIPIMLRLASFGSTNSSCGCIPGFGMVWVCWNWLDSFPFIFRSLWFLLMDPFIIMVPWFCC